MKYSLPFLLIALVQGCSSLSTASEQSASDPCKATGENFTIRHHENRALTICPIDAPTSCHQDFYLQAYEHRQIDLNQNSRMDEVVIIQSGLVGIDHDLSYYAVFLACGEGLYRRVLFDAFTKIEPAEKPPENGFLSFDVTRSCYEPASGKFITHKYLIKYDPQMGGYGLPNGDEGLRDFCGPYELSLPNAFQTQ